MHGERQQRSMTAEPNQRPWIAAALADARRRTLSLVSDLRDDQWSVPLLEIINPPLWEIGHVAYFAEYWTLRRLYGHAPIVTAGDALYDSARIPHDLRWSLPLPSREETYAFLERQLAASLERFAAPSQPKEADYFYRLALHHEDMHGEALIYTRQTLSYGQPEIALYDRMEPGALVGDAAIPGGHYGIGARPDDGFVFDNEKWFHEVEVRPFSIARAPVTNAEYLAFVEDGGYENQTHWARDGWAWRTAADAHRPVYWQGDGRRPLRRHFDRIVELRPHEPVCHVNLFEADAYCRWAGRRLPTEPEWEIAAAGSNRRRYAWGEETATPERANLDSWYGDVCDVGAFAGGESPFGCRQMIGNVWEWTSTPFEPYPGFAPDPYKEYSEPWFGDHFVLRGGAWSTRARLVTTRWRNFYRPHRRDVVAGFRTCAPR